MWSPYNFVIISWSSFKVYSVAPHTSVVISFTFPFVFLLLSLIAGSYFFSFCSLIHQVHHSLLKVCFPCVRERERQRQEAGEREHVERLGRQKWAMEWRRVTVAAMHLRTRGAMAYRPSFLPHKSAIIQSHCSPSELTDRTECSHTNGTLLLA